MSTQPAPTGATTEVAAPAAAVVPAPQPRQRTEVAAFDPNDPIALYMNTGIFDQLQRVAAMMAKSTYVPDHFRAGFVDKQNNKKDLATATGDCFLVAAQAFRWGMDPFAVAQDTFVVKGTLGYGGKVIGAVVNTHTRVEKELDYVYSGSGDGRKIVASATLRGHGVRSIEGTVGQWKTDNPKWREQPDQQLAYRANREWARRWIPEAILGVKSEEDAPDVVDITPAPAALPEPTGPRGLSDVTAKLQAETLTPPTHAEALASVERVVATAPDPDAADAEREPPPACEHKPLWNLARAAKTSKPLACPTCDRDVVPMEILACADAAKGKA